ncbi:MAG: E2 protein [Melanogrammus aeglefinus-associated papillomavirus 2]|nr:MAG: E2 protein [Melanogrammus aeglefinus-associated papillomavirus 2]
MSSIYQLHAIQVSIQTAERNIKSLADGIEILKEKLDLNTDFTNFRKVQKLPNVGQDLSSRKSAVHIPSVAAIHSENNQLEQVLKACVRVFQDFGNSPGWKPVDFTWGVYNSSPARVLKKGTHYNTKGVVQYTTFYVPSMKGGFTEDKPVIDKKGHYFTGLGNTRHYYYLLADSEAEPQSGPSTSAKKKSTPRLGPKTSLGRKGHGLSRLLAEAKDPPIIEWKGSLEVIKGFRKRASAKYSVKCSSTYRWNKDHRCMFEFPSYEARDKFLKECTLKLPDYRLGAFDTK